MHTESLLDVFTSVSTFRYIFEKWETGQSFVVHACHASTQEAESGIQQIQAQPGQLKDLARFCLPPPKAEKGQGCGSVEGLRSKPQNHK